MKTEIPVYLNVIFVALTISLAGLIVFGVYSTLKRMQKERNTALRTTGIVALVITCWLTFLQAISSMNILEQWNELPPPLLMVFLPPLVITIILASLNKFKNFLQHVPHQWLLFLQSFRIIMEFILLFMFLENIIPQQMTFEGRNYDIIVGSSALLIGVLFIKNKISKHLLVAWNIFGLIILANIVTVAILSSPLPVRVFMNDPSNTIIAYFPFVWLPGFVVPVAYFTHVCSIKKALMDRVPSGVNFRTS